MSLCLLETRKSLKLLQWGGSTASEKQEKSQPALTGKAYIQDTKLQSKQNSLLVWNEGTS